MAHEALGRRNAAPVQSTKLDLALRVPLLLRGEEWVKF
jgi:hypothetical protein